MADTGRIHASFDQLKAAYPTYNRLPKEIKAYLDDLNKENPGNTPCCMQVSYALNKVGETIPASSYRRRNAKIGPYYYVSAVDELEQYLSGVYGRGENIRKDSSGKQRSRAQMQQYLNGKQGILVFRNGGAGFHTELWDQDHILQNGAPASNGAAMNQDAIFNQPRVLFWNVGPDSPDAAPVPDWLKGWWNVYDGNTYYYYFSSEYVVTYTKTAPKNLLMPPVKVPLNEGDVSVTQNGTVMVLDWNPADGGATQETFTRITNETMSGVSNRYAPLFATKMK